MLYKTERWVFSLPFQFYLPRPEIKSLGFFVACASLLSLSSSSSPPPPIINNLSKECSSFFCFRSYCTLDFKDVINYFREVHP